VLLEVVLALALFVAAAAVIGSGLNASLSSVERLRLRAHALDLAVTVMSELQLGARAVETPGTAQAFDPPFDDWTWEVQLTPLDDEVGQQSSLTCAEVVIRHKAPPLVQRLSQVLPVDSVKRGRLGTTPSSATGGTP
jgi:type II secretory pathway pseudopilin PulG